MKCAICGREISKASGFISDFASDVFEPLCKECYKEIRPFEISEI